jgi:acetolactate synthase I/II/III large subunit
MIVGTAIRVADYVMRALTEAGVGHVFMLPGGGAMYLNDALALSELECVPCHHEQACGIAAEAYGRISENLGVAMVTTGPGATNVLTPVVGAWIESSPMLIVSGQVKRADRLRGAPLRQRGVQEVDVVPMVRSVTKCAVTVDDPESIRYHVEKALHLARTGRRGPVWLDIPLDVQAAPVHPDRLEGYVPDAASPTDIAAAARRVMSLLQSAERPLFLAGHGIRLSGAAAAFRALVERLGVPMASTWNALDILPYDHDLCVGRPGVVALRPPNFAVQTCDLLIAVGARLDNVITAYDPRNFARMARKVVVDVDQNEIDKLDMELELAICADASEFVSALSAAAEAAPPRDRTSWLSRLASWKRRYPILDGAPFVKRGAIGHYHFVEALSTMLQPDTLIATGSSGLAVEVFYSAFRNKSGQRVFLTSGLGAMGYGLPAAIGACLANGSKPMVAIESDGSLMLNLQELATLRALQLPVLLLVMNNNGYASIRNTQRNYFDSRFIGTGPESGLWMPDFTQVAQAFGLSVMRIERPEHLDEALRQALGAGRPCVCDVRLEEYESLMPKVSAVPRPDGSIVSMPLEDMSPLLTLDALRAEVGSVSEASIAARPVLPPVRGRTTAASRLSDKCRG